MIKYICVTVFTTFIVFIQIFQTHGQTGTKADMFGASGIPVTYDKSIIVNGDFSAEYSYWSFDQGTNGYHIRADGISEPGDIQVGSNPSSFNKGYRSSYASIPGFDAYGDHTTGSGNFLMVDGRCNSIYIKLWKQTVLIKPNTYYLFSIWVSSLKDNPNHPGVLIFNIGGKNIDLNIVAPYKGGATTESAGGGWVHFEKIWYSDSTNGSVLLSIENNNTETCNSEVDFGIDDIELKPVKSITENIPKSSSLKQFKNVLFETGSYTIDAAYFKLLNEISKELKASPTDRIYIKGYTDSQDSFENNLELSYQRAMAIKNYLISKGIADNRFTIKGFGETRPVDSNDIPEGRQQNRRAEIYLMH